MQRADPRVDRQLAHGFVRRFGCPTCGAAAGAPCRGTRGPRASNHVERVNLAEADPDADDHCSARLAPEAIVLGVSCPRCLAQGTAKFLPGDTARATRQPTAVIWY
jgi:predicted RNA-binding Zn-ribbon protein involved in translation (DUF1610 family)